MQGRIRRQLAARQALALALARPGGDAGEGAALWPLCPLCERPIPPAQQDAHHLVPRSRGGRHTEVMHRICHRQIHALLTEAELAQRFHTVEALMTLPEVRRFVDWVRTKPDDFFARTRKSERVRR